MFKKIRNYFARKKLKNSELSPVGECFARYAEDILTDKVGEDNRIERYEEMLQSFGELVKPNFDIDAKEDRCAAATCFLLTLTEYGVHRYKNCD